MNAVENAFSAFVLLLLNARWRAVPLLDAWLSDRLTVAIYYALAEPAFLSYKEI